MEATCRTLREFYYGKGRLGVQLRQLTAEQYQALHARLLGFTHPAGGGRLMFDSRLPADIRELVDNLERL